MSEPETASIADVVNSFSEAFDKLCQERHEAGQAEYGQFTFVGNDLIRMMAEELADTSNYCRMQFIKLMMLQHALEEDPKLQALAEGEETITIGVGSFKGTKEVGW
jgi:hypothetical protein